VGLVAGLLLFSGEAMQLVEQLGSFIDCHDVHIQRIHPYQHIKTLVSKQV